MLQKQFLPFQYLLLDDKDVASLHAKLVYQISVTFLAIHLTPLLKDEVFLHKADHRLNVVTLNAETNNEVQGDALYTSTVKKVCAIMTADCLPVLFTTLDGTEVGAAHGGVRKTLRGSLFNPD